MVYLLALTTALVNAVASILQRLGVEEAPLRASGRAGVVGYMVTNGVWLVGFVAMGGGFVAQAIALHLGTLAVVQPVLVTELVFVVLALGLWYGMDLRARDVVASLAATGGLAGFLATAAPTAGAQQPSLERWALCGGVVAVAALGCVVASSHGKSWWRALWLGAAASVGFALTAALTKTATDKLHVSIGALFTSFPLYALVAIGLGSFVLMQHAFHSGPFAASQSTLILVNPFVATGLGAVLFGDTLRHTTGAIVLEVLCLVVMGAGAVTLAGSSLVVGVHDEDPNSHLLVGRGRLARYRARRAFR